MSATKLIQRMAATILAGTSLLAAASASGQMTGVSPRSDDVSGLNRATEMRLWLAADTPQREAAAGFGADVYVTFDGVNFVLWQEGGEYYAGLRQSGDTATGPMPDSLRQLSTTWMDARYAEALTLGFEPNVRADFLAMAASRRVGVLFLRSGLLTGEPFEAISEGEGPALADCYDLSYPTCGGGSCPPNSICVAVNILGTLQFCACAGLGFDFSLLGVDGACPGTVVVYWERTTPNTNAGLVFSTSLGNFLIASGPCSGTKLILAPTQLQLVTTINTGPNGSGRVSGQAGQGACGGYLQMVVINGQPCGTSNAAKIH